MRLRTRPEGGAVVSPLLVHVLGQAHRVPHRGGVPHSRWIRPFNGGGGVTGLPASGPARLEVRPLRSTSARPEGRGKGGVVVGSHALRVLGSEGPGGAEGRAAAGGGGAGGRHLHSHLSI